MSCSVVTAASALNVTLDPASDTISCATGGRRRRNQEVPMAAVAKSLFHPVVAVSSMAAAVAFYRDLLGLRVTFDDDHDPVAIEALFGYPDPVVHAVVVGFPDGSEIELVEFERPRGTPVARRPGDPGLMAINFIVEGIDEFVDRLTTAGYPPTSGIVVQTLPDGGQIRVVVCRAPDDVTVILVELPPGRSSLAAPADRA
jgi:catechol 2,3-dioxygenase-like lactoylglutathione lyase family enzyme